MAAASDELVEIDVHELEDKGESASRLITEIKENPTRDTRRVWWCWGEERVVWEPEFLWDFRPK